MTTFLTEEELAAKLRKSKRTIQRWCNERRIPFLQIGRDRLFTDAQVDEIVAAYTVEPVETVAEHELRNPAFEQRSVVVHIDPKHRRGTAA